MLRLLALAIGLALLAYLVVALGPGEILAFLGRIGWGFLPIAALYLCYQALRGLALKASVVAPGGLSAGEALAIRLSGESVQLLTSTGPWLAEPAKALLLARRGLSTAAGFAATIAEYLAYKFVTAVMLAGAMAFLLVRVDLNGAVRHAAAVLLVGSVAFLAVAAIAIVTRTHLIGWAVARLGALPLVGHHLRLDAGPVRQMEDDLLEVLRERPARFATVTLLEVAANALLVLELWTILWLSGVVVSPGRALLMESAVKFTGVAFFFVPAQVGAAEGVNAVLFETLGLAASAGVGLSLARRIRSLLAAGLGLGALALLTRRGGHS